LPITKHSKAPQGGKDLPNPANLNEFSSASHYRRKIDESLSSFINPAPTLIASVCTLFLLRRFLIKLSGKQGGFEDGFIYLFICLLQIASSGNVVVRIEKSARR